MSNTEKELKPKRVYVDTRTSKKTGNDYVVLVVEFDLGNGRKYEITEFLNNDQKFILGV